MQPYIAANEPATSQLRLNLSTIRSATSYEYLGPRKGTIVFRLFLQGTRDGNRRLSPTEARVALEALIGCRRVLRR